MYVVRMIMVVMISVYVYVKVFCKGFFVGCELCSYVGGYEDDND